MNENIGWIQRKDWIEERSASDELDTSILIAQIWLGDEDSWLKAYSEYARVKAAATIGLDDVDLVLDRLSLWISEEAERRFGDDIMSKLSRRVKAAETAPDLVLVAAAREFCRPFEDHIRGIRDAIYGR